MASKKPANANGAAPRGRGRPALPEADLRTHQVLVRLSEAEYNLICQIAVQEGRTLPAILRMGALSWSARRLKKGE